MKRKTDLDGKTWTRYSISVWDDIEKDTEERKLKHPAMFPRALAGRLIKVLTRPGDLVIDIFAGSGSTLLAACGLGRRAAGFEIVEEYVELTRTRLSEQRDAVNFDCPQAEIYHDDASRIKNYLSPESVNLCVTSPPYWDILGLKRTADGKEIRNYEKIGSLSNVSGYGEFVRALGEIFMLVYDVLLPGGYLVVNVMDLRKGPHFFPLHMDLAMELRQDGYILDDIIIWDRRREYNRLRPLGYPYVFRVNKVHEYLLIFQKPVS